jgi:hypothetical protein
VAGRSGHACIEGERAGVLNWRTERISLSTSVYKYNRAMRRVRQIIVTFLPVPLQSRSLIAARFHSRFLAIPNVAKVAVISSVPQHGRFRESVPLADVDHQHQFSDSILPPRVGHHTSSKVIVAALHGPNLILTVK